MCYSIFSKLKMEERNIMRLINRFFNVAKRCFVLGLTIFYWPDVHLEVRQAAKKKRMTHRKYT